LSWDFSSIKELHIVFGYGYDKQAVPGQGSRQVCPSLTTTYKAIVTKLDNSEVTYQLTVNVSGSGCGDPYVLYFDAIPDSVGVGGKVSIFWHVECAKAVWLQIPGSEQGVVGWGSKTDIVLYSTTTFKLKIQKTSGDYVYASCKVKVK